MLTRPGAKASRGSKSPSVPADFRVKPRGPYGCTSASRSGAGEKNPTVLQLYDGPAEAAGSGSGGNFRQDFVRDFWGLARLGVLQAAAGFPREAPPP